MKRKVLVTMLCLAISVSAIACGTENTTEQLEETATKQTTEKEEVEMQETQETEVEESAVNVEEIETQEEMKTTLPESVETEYYGTIYPAETARLVEEAYNEWYASIDVEELKEEYGDEWEMMAETLAPMPKFGVVEREGYPDSRTDHQQAWDAFCMYFNPSDYGTTLYGRKGTDFSDLGFCALSTGYSWDNLKEVYTDKGYKAYYDINTGIVYYDGMILPTGSIYEDRESGGVLGQFLLDNANNPDINVDTVWDITYEQRQALLGVYSED
ncbi:hypothetical protein [Acetivibrio ethanolgignens]|uniref:Uncharacterized protein n=1 Tax=Acetivibrio ethanolgignens TaxID=290052 RepID=A0A0V8QBY8_9FIRM|nr:hypothetical protein [Acetivibrio ethanolgignens]KSV57918.1 hypothetical protein ASU35_14865 [Acetivibrio ethanolgignens]